MLAPHGHAAYGRLEASDVFNEPARAASLARQGYVVFTYDMVGYNDSFQVPHDYAAPEAALWSFSVLGSAVVERHSRRWTSWRRCRTSTARESARPGASGGGTQTFLLAAVDDRVKVSIPSTMVSHYMQGGDNCENTAGLRLDHSNVEFAAHGCAAADAADLGDRATGRGIRRVWSSRPSSRSTSSTARRTHLSHVQFHALHNFNRESREASYAFFARG